MLMVISTGGIAVFLLNFLGIFPSVQRHLRVPTRTADHGERAILRDVSPFVLLHCKNGWWFTNGASAPNHFCDYNILDGWPKAFPHHFRPNPSHHPSQRARCSGARPGTRRGIDGCKASYDLLLRVDVGVSISQWILHSTYSIVYGVAEIYLV